MPELPKVETVKRGLQPTVEGRRLTSVETRRGDLRAPFPEDFESRLTGRRVERVWRRGEHTMRAVDGGLTAFVLPALRGSHWGVYTASTGHCAGKYPSLVLSDPPARASRVLGPSR